MLIIVRSWYPHALFQKGLPVSGYRLLSGWLMLIIAGQFGLAQPTGQRIAEEAAVASAGRDSLVRERGRIEAEYLIRANQAIEKYRKGDAQIRIVDASGKPLRNLSVTINQVSQDFLFGNLVFELGGFVPKEPYKTDLFKERFKALFNFAVLPFYWANYERKQGTPDWKRNQEALDWCRANGITAKGHTLGWTSPAGTPG